MGFKPIIDVTNLTACCVIKTLSESKEEEQPYFSVLLASLKTKNVLVRFSVKVLVTQEKQCVSHLCDHFHNNFDLQKLCNWRTWPMAITKRF